MSQSLETSPAPAPGDADDPRHRADRPAAVASAKTPVNSSSLTVLGLLWALLLTALGAVGVHDALVAAGLFASPQWIGWVVDQVGELEPDTGLLVVATVVGLIGLVLLLLALRPRRKRGVAVGAESGTFLRHRHLSRLVAARVETLDGVVSAKASARRRTINVGVRGVDGVDAADLTARAQQEVDAELAVLDKPVRARVRVEGRTS